MTELPQIPNSSGYAKILPLEIEISGYLNEMLLICLILLTLCYRFVNIT